MTEKLLIGGMAVAALAAIYLIHKNSTKAPPMALLGAEPNSTEQPPGTAYEVTTYPLQVETLGKAAAG